MDPNNQTQSERRQAYDNARLQIILETGQQNGWPNTLINDDADDIDQHDILIEQEEDLVDDDFENKNEDDQSDKNIGWKSVRLYTHPANPLIPTHIYLAPFI